MASASNSTTLNPYGYTLTASFNENSTSVANNTSNVTCTATLQANGSYWSSSYSSTLTIYWHDNRENYDRWVASTSFAGLGGGWDSKSCSGTIDVTHNADGSLSGYAYAVFTRGSTTSSYAPYDGSVNNGWTALTAIPRASTPSIDGTIYTGTNCTVKTNRPSGTSFTHVLSYTFGTKTGYIADADHKAGDSCTWSIPANFSEEYASNATSMDCTITCDTYSGSTKIGTKTYTKSITLNTNVVPTISSATSQDGNSIIKSLDLTVYLTGKSYPELSITASGIERSTISTYYAALNPINDTDAENNAVTGTSVSDLNTKVKKFTLIAGTNNIKVWVADSRGYKSAKANISLITRAYTSPTINPFNVARCKSTSDLTEDDEGTAVKLSAAGSITDILASNGTTHKNTMYCKTRYKPSGGDWSDLSNLSGGVSGYSFDKTGTNSVALAGTFPTTAKYDIEIYLYDTISLKESGWSGSGKPTEEQLAKLYKQSKSILTGFDLMHFHKSGKSVSFGKKSEAGDTDKWFEVRMDQIHFEGNVTVNGNPIESLPIGTILPYSSTTIPSGYMLCDGSAISRTIYSDLFAILGTTYGSGDGSTTFNIPDLRSKFILGNGTNHNVGTSGGAETVTLTVDQMPSHTHTQKSCTNPGDHAHNTWNTFSQKVASGGITITMTGEPADGRGNATQGAGGHTHTIVLNNTGGGQAHENMPPYLTMVYMIKVAAGNATVPSSVTISNADVAQITTNKNDITNIKTKTDHIGDYVVLRRNSDLTWNAGGQGRVDKFQFTQVYSSYGTGLTATDTNQRVLIGAGVNAVRVTYHLNKSEADQSSNWIMGYIYKNNTPLKRSITKADKWAQLDDTMIIPVQEGDIIGLYVQTDLSGNIVFPTYDSFANCGGMQILNVEVVR